MALSPQLAEATDPGDPFASVSGLAFGEPDARHGPWRSYFVGVVGGVAADEDDVLWPNQVCVWGGGRAHVRLAGAAAHAL